MIKQRGHIYKEKTQSREKRPGALSLSLGGGRRSTSGRVPFPRIVFRVAGLTSGRFTFTRRSSSPDATSPSPKNIFAPRGLRRLRGQRPRPQSCDLYKKRVLIADWLRALWVACGVVRPRLLGSAAMGGGASKEKEDPEKWFATLWKPSLRMSSASYSHPCRKSQQTPALPATSPMP